MSESLYQQADKAKQRQIDRATDFISYLSTNELWADGVRHNTFNGPNEFYLKLAGELPSVEYPIEIAKIVRRACKKFIANTEHLDM